MNILIPDIIGHVGNIGFILGAFLISRKNIYGFFALGWGNIAYIIQGFIIGTYSLVFISLYLLLMNIYGIYNWRKKK